MKVIIAGGRDFNNYQYLCDVMDNLDIIISEVVCGSARGADSLGEQWALNYNIPVKYFPADWDELGKYAGIARNQEMAEYADFLVAFWDGESHGTKNMILTMQQLEKHGKVVRYKNS